MFSLLVGRCLWIASLLVVPHAAGAEPAGGQVTLAANARVTLTRADFEEELSRRIPERQRAEFASSPQRVTALLNELLLKKTLAAEAREAGLDREPLPRSGDADADGVLAQRFLQKLDADARAEFDRRIDAFTARAREEYLVHRERYEAKEQIEVSQLFVASAMRGDEAALWLATNARADLINGADFAQLAKDFPDDRVTGLKLARGKWISRDQVESTLAKILFALNEIGEITEPIRTRAGYYLFRLEGKRPARQQTFDEVKDQILVQLRQAHVEGTRVAKSDAIVMDPGLSVNQPAVDALVPRLNPEAVRRATQSVPAKPPAN